MSTQHSSREFASDGREGLGQKAANAANDAFANASAMAEQAAQKARQAASDTAATVSEQVRQLLDRQVSSGAEMVGQVAGAVKRTAQELEGEAPQLASLVRSAGDQIDGYADGLRDQSVEQLMRAASDFTRRQPALVFGLAALAGFVALRTIKSTPSSVTSPPIQPSQYGRE